MSDSKKRAAYSRVSVLSTGTLCVGAIFFALLLKGPGIVPRAPAPGKVSEAALDDVLQRAAAAALGQREGTIIVMDPQTGRVRAIVNSQIAFEAAFAPGSTIKPFVALAALRAGVIDQNSRTLCREHYSRRDFSTVCAHPRDLPPLNATEAIAYSCNYYFGTLGERLDEAQLSETLRSFGFGRPTGARGDREVTGSLLRGKRDPRNTLGEGEYLQVTPIQLITAYSALVNGGRLLTPGVAGAAEFQAAGRAQLEIAPAQRSLIIEGMRGAIRYGSAKNASLDFQSLDTFGKTGTSTPARGFRTQGWFVGFAADSVLDGQPAPDQIQLAVLVFLKRSHGSEAAALSRSVFEAYQNHGQAEATAEGRGDETPASANLSESGPQHSPITITPSPRAAAPATVRIHLVSENVTREMPLEDYVAGVVATEGSMEDQPEALKALAVAARTYALKNLGRHANEGFDFCTTTHCQRYQAGASAAASEGASAQPRGGRNGRAYAAAGATEGEVLYDEHGRLVDAYFGASCGGSSANIQTLWGVTGLGYLRGGPDEYCATGPHHLWTDVIPAAQLLRALRSDPRTDPGERLNDVVVARRDATGRAELLTIDGSRRRVVSGWDFKIIVGRALGWSKLKSSRFEIARAGSEFIFHGSGFGHGLGLCQEGAHVMAQRGISYKPILAKYFPGTNVAKGRSVAALSSSKAGRSNEHQTFADLIWENEAELRRSLTSREHSQPVSPVRRLSLSSEHFRISYPATESQKTIEGILGTLESSHSDLLNRVRSAGVSAAGLATLEVFINDTTGNFVGRTGQPFWAAAATRGNRIELQPLAVLEHRGVLNTTLRHELVHAVIDKISQGRAPRWLAEGMALYFAREGAMVAGYAPRATLTLAEVDRKLAGAKTADQMRAAYAAAYRQVDELIRREGEASVWRRAAAAT